MARIVSEEELPVRQCIPKAEVKCFGNGSSAIRQLVEFLLRTGSIDSRFTGFDRALEGAHIHRKLQKAAGDGYQAEVFLSVERQAEDITFTLEGRADGIFTDETGTVVIDEIKTTAVPPEEILRI